MREAALPEVPAEAARIEFKVSNSLFIASLDFAPSLEEARAFLAKVRAEFSDATHNVPAFVVGGEKSRTEFCSDDGEPGGTAGRPVLAVLRGSGLSDAALVVTRYFGGSLLGTGGLVRAYSEAARLVLEKLPRARLVEVSRLCLRLPYAFYGPCRRAAEEMGALVSRATYGDGVELELEIPSEDEERLRSLVAGISAGTVSCELLGSASVRRPIP